MTIDQIEATPPPETTTHRRSRRRFLSRLGAGGLATSALIFGTAEAAGALCIRKCCQLYVCPNVTYSHCRSGTNYTWSCYYRENEPSYTCHCCEHGGLKPNWHGHSAHVCNRN
jgi:hypothetical protein